MANELTILDDFIIEGFDPKKLDEIKNKVDKELGWKKVYGAYQNQKILNGRVRAIQKFGAINCAVVEVEDVQGIIPIDFFGVNNKRQLRNFVGEEVVFRVVNYDREKEIFTGSRVKARNQMARMTLNRIEEGDVIPFVISRVTTAGLFGDVGGIEAQIPIDEIRYGWIDNPHDEFERGDHLLVKILEINEKEISDEAENKREFDDDRDEIGKKYEIIVSSKALMDNPWEDIDIVARLPEGSEHEGIVTGVTDYGVFIRLLDGVDSLASHLRFENPQKGDKVVVRILDVDIEKEQVRSRILKVK